MSDIRIQSASTIIQCDMTIIVVKFIHKSMNLPFPSTTHTNKESMSIPNSNGNARPLHHHTTPADGSDIHYNFVCDSLVHLEKDFMDNGPAIDITLTNHLLAHIYSLLDIFLERIFYKETCTGMWTSILLDTEKKLKGAFTAVESRKNIPEWYFMFQRNEHSCEVKSLKFFNIYSNQNTYKYTVFLSYLLWKHNKHMVLNMTTITELLVGDKWN